MSKRISQYRKALQITLILGIVYSTFCSGELVNAYSDTKSPDATRLIEGTVQIQAGSSNTSKISLANATSVDLDPNQAFLFSPLRPGKYDDTYQNSPFIGSWMYVGNWLPLYVNGAYNDTVTYSNEVGAYVTVLINGAQFELTYTGYPTRGEVEIFIDNELVVTLDQYNPTLAWQQTWLSPKLDRRAMHAVKFVVKSGYIDIDAIEIFPFNLLGIGKYDDTDFTWIYSGNWASANYPGDEPYNGTLHYSSTIGDYATLEFQGTQVILTYTGYPNRGEVEIYIDTELVATLNQYSPTLAWQQTAIVPPVANGTHFIKFVHSSGGYVDIDAIEIIAPLDLDTTPPAAITTLSAATGTSSYGTVDLSWTAVGDDGTTGTATSYLIRYSTSPITDKTTWDNATQFPSPLYPKSAGEVESLTVTGLTPNLTYYFAVRAQDEKGNLGGLSNAASASAKGPPPLSPGKYDDSELPPAYDLLGVYSDLHWIYYTNNGPYENTLHYSDYRGSYIALAFQGNQFIVTYTGYPNRGQMDVVVDNITIGTIDQYEPTLNWQRIWISPILANSGPHTLKLVHASGGYVDLDAIQILQVSPAGLGKYDDTHGNWSYSGNWLPLTISGAYNNTVTYSNAVGAYATFLMDGAQFKLTYTGYPTRGEVEVYVDTNPTPIATFSEYDPNLVWQKTWLSPDLGAGVHTVKFVVKSGYIDIDAIEVLGTPTPVGAGKYDDTYENWTYAGNWIPLSISGAYDDTVTYSNAVGAYASFLMDGAQFKLTYTGYPTRGEVEVYVDTNPTPIATFSEYDPNLVWQKTWLSPDLGAGEHTVKFVVKSGYIDIDAIEVLELPRPKGPGTYDDTYPAWSYTGSWLPLTISGATTTPSPTRTR
jgi:hypothetical protein